jgi:hypothetical protein
MKRCKGRLALCQNYASVPLAHGLVVVSPTCCGRYTACYDLLCASGGHIKDEKLLQSTLAECL